MTREEIVQYFEKMETEAKKLISKGENPVRFFIEIPTKAEELARENPDKTEMIETLTGKVIESILRQA